MTGARDYAILEESVAPSEGPPGAWVMYLAEDALGSYPHDPLPIHAFLMFEKLDRVFQLRGDFTNLDEARSHYGTSYLGRTIGSWRRIPDDVEATPAATSAWLLRQIQPGD